MSLQKQDIAQWFKGLQDRICAGLEEFDGQFKFQEDQWKRPGGGGGRTRVIANGKVLEKGGVNFSAVEGELPEKIASALQLPAQKFFASGVSIVLHPQSPMVPIIHMNVRYFEVGQDTCWFGGGIDLTPHYFDADQAKAFHRRLKATCDLHGADLYEQYKKWADDYFYIKHRKETRGVGGIFFDRLQPSNKWSKSDIWQFVQGVGDTFLPAYLEAAQPFVDRPYGEEQKQWQMMRRGRYVEFNLVYDKGTKFGLDTDGRIESILMSLPTRAGWEYDFQPAPDSPEARTLEHLIKGVDFVNL